MLRAAVCLVDIFLVPVRQTNSWTLLALLLHRLGFLVVLVYVNGCFKIIIIICSIYQQDLTQKSILN